MFKKIALGILLAASIAEAQMSPTVVQGRTVATPDPKISQGEYVINSDLSLPPGNYRVDVVVVDGVGNQSAPITLETFNIPAIDVDAPTVENPLCVKVADGMRKCMFTCRDNVACDGAGVIVTVTPVP